MGWNQALFPLVVITAAPTGFSGLFAYSPGPGAGNLITSIAAADGTDPYGNAFLHGTVTYSVVGGRAIAQGWQDGNVLFATAATQAGPYQVASGVLRVAYGTLVNGFFGAADVNGTSDPPVVTQTDAHTIVMAGRLGTPPSGPVLLTTFATLSTPFVLPSLIVAEFPTNNVVGGQSGSVILRPNGNLQLNGSFGNSATVLTCGAFRF